MPSYAETAHGSSLTYTYLADSVLVDIAAGMLRDLFFVTDLLGNVRSIADVSPGLTAPVILEQNDYLPFGTKVQNPSYANVTESRYRYAGKEEQNIGGVNLSLLDFGARYYDPYVARWTSVDPVSGNYLGVTPYNYSNCNPVFYADPDGKNPAAVGGFVVGVGLDLAVQVASNIITKREDQSLIECFTNIDGMSLLKSGVSGAAGVGIINKVKKVSAIYNLGKVASATLEAGYQATAGAAIEVASEAISGESIDFAEVGKSASTAAFSSAAGNVAKSATLNSATGQKELKVAKNQLDRAQRVARGDAPKISRLNAVDSAKQQIDNVGESSKRNVTNAAGLLLQFKNKIDDKKTK